MLGQGGPGFQSGRAKEGPPGYYPGAFRPRIKPRTARFGAPEGNETATTKESSP